MVNYRRVRVAGGTYFFTVALKDRRATTLTDHIASLREAFKTVRQARPFVIEAMVVLPEHLHAVWTLPSADADYSGRWRAIKSRLVRNLRAGGVDVGCNPRGEADVWQRRFWEHQIRDENDLARHVDYIHYNPVKHRWVTRAADWRWSSFHHYVRRGWLPKDWGLVDASVGDFGE